MSLLLATINVKMNVKRLCLVPGRGIVGFVKEEALSHEASRAHFPTI